MDDKHIVINHNVHVVSGFEILFEITFVRSFVRSSEVTPTTLPRGDDHCSGLRLHCNFENSTSAVDVQKGMRRIRIIDGSTINQQLNNNNIRHTFRRNQYSKPKLAIIHTSGDGTSSRITTACISVIRRVSNLEFRF